MREIDALGPRPGEEEELENELIRADFGVDVADRIVATLRQGRYEKGIAPEELRGERVSAGLFALLGVRPFVGRAFRAEEDRPGRADAVILSYELWQRRFGADAD